jgi:hypothetical protein
VLGDAVNMAARIEQAADGGQILMSANTVRLTEPHVRVRDLGQRELRGFAQQVQLFELIGLAEDAEEELEAHAAARSQAAGGRSIVSQVAAPLLAVLLLSPVAAAPGQAQLLERLPTLESLVVTSADGTFQLGLSGRLDIEGFLPQADPAWIIPSTTPFVAPRLRLFADALLGDHVIGSMELRVDGGEEPRAEHIDVRIDQLFLRVTPIAAIAVQAGKFVSPFGGWPQRHHTAADPFIRPPLSYDYRTILSAAEAPASVDALLAWKDNPDVRRPAGAPVVWGAPYQWGAMLMGTVAGVDWRGAALNSAPSSEPDEWGLDRGMSAPSFVFNAGTQLSPAVRVELSYNRGPWLREDVTGLPDGWQASDYNQQIWGAEAVFKYGRTKLRGELFHDTWGVPNVGYGAVDVSWYAEAEQAVSPAFTLAARVGAIHFLKMSGGEGAGSGWDYGTPWDYNVRRLQLASGYRVARNAGIRAELMLNGTAAPLKPRDNLAALQLWWEF